MTREILFEEIRNSPDAVTILEYLSEGFEKDLFISTLRNLSDKGNPLRFNNFSYCMREIISILLRRLSSDEHVIKCSWYKNETQEENGVSRKQRFKYAVHGGLSKKFIEEFYENELDDCFQEFVRLFKELNKYTHIREKTFNISDEECEALANDVLEIISQILTNIIACRQDLMLQVRDHVDDALLQEFIGNVFDDLDILSTHTSVDYIDAENIEINLIDSGHVHIVGEGNVYLKLQYGSGSDMRNGQGATLDQNFPYTFKCSAPVTDLKAIIIGGNDIKVDTSSWYE